MRLLIFGSEFPPGPGGIGTHAYQLARQLQNKGWEIVVLTIQDYISDDEAQSFNSQQDFPVYRLESRRINFLDALYRFSRLREIVKAWLPNLLLASGARMVWLAAATTISNGLPWVAVGHGTEFASKKLWERAITRWAYSRANGIVSVSEFTKRRMLDMGIQSSRARVIPNGADEGQFYPLDCKTTWAFRQKLGFSNENILLTVGNVSKRKGQDVVIRALPKILETFPNTHYLIVGLPTRKSSYSALADRLGVGEHVHFIGKVKDEQLSAFYNAADIFVMNSRFTDDGDFEGYGIAVVEAALCGKPAVVSGGSGLEEAIAADRTGLVVPQNQFEKTAKAILNLLGNAEKRSQMGRQARQRALEQQTWEHRAVQFDDFLREVLKG